MEPLKLSRTDASGAREGSDNVSKAYMVLDDGSPVETPITPQSGKTMMGAAGGVVSCIGDLLVLYNTMMDAAEDQLSNGATETVNNPFRQLSSIYGDVSSYYPPGSQLPRICIWNAMNKDATA